MTSTSACGRTYDSRLFALALGFLLVTAPLELSQIAFVLVGAGLYAVLQSVKASSRSDAGGGPAVPSIPGTSSDKALDAAHQVPAEAVPAEAKGKCALVFKSKGWESQVAELLKAISATPQGNEVVESLADDIRRNLQEVVPEVKVTGFSSGDLIQGSALPEVDIVVNVSQEVLIARSFGRVSGLDALRSPSRPIEKSAASSSVASFTGLDAKKLQKSAIRSLTDRLVARGGYKFRRSAFRGLEPKVTLLAPAALGISQEPIPFEFSVNGNTSHYSAALVTACGKIDHRARDLITLVRRWSKDRGICHVAKGHFSPYAWTILAIYYMQVADKSSILPTFQEFDIPSSLAESCDERPEASQGKAILKVAKSAAELFHGFLHFYAKEFDWKEEGVCLRRGSRSVRTLRRDADGDSSATCTEEVGPHVEDPFEPGRNLGECTTGPSLARLHEELDRAEMVSRETTASLERLLEPWKPPERTSPE
mmetsp:Transcript_52586/g.94404  ORF Transcript_52586/g.94404 Transcript_52586/m.94404 type:complete len:481 (+) Transcript_52586:185-1627(+)|eukprot:CAMPEP_0197632288 /NCGR_PEP_ID=MMETSP1338-20131121/9113_1 /TAXON_ID=43686 ORGANISM="Pelagodinium beii, Strain RCC1491" /NCGR_SAMPLE_ID=MMETSP1338 /ASSEMBLY_ACC=CAM_ASM_000754 /LENGTH=480 /DNA_ID=CAMNT_0043203847 /DNA_START=109 /DNA_END=1551 /DNA_ORIENTATION=-